MCGAHTSTLHGDQNSVSFRNVLRTSFVSESKHLTTTWAPLRHLPLYAEPYAPVSNVSCERDTSFSGMSQLAISSPLRFEACAILA